MLFLDRCLTLVCLQFLIFATGFSHVESRKGFGDISQEWGYVTVRPGAKMFWWLYYTTSKDVTDPHDKPLLIWLQGGPGSSSTGYGNFEEFGPLDLDLKPRNFTWVNDYNVLFIDNPVGTGFSYIETIGSPAMNNAQIASDLLEFVREFYKEAPKWLPVPVYITSESYGGKMAVEFALVWHQEQKAERIKSNVRGVVLIDSWISPLDSILSYAPFILQTGMVDPKGARITELWANYVKLAMESGDWRLATSRSVILHKWLSVQTSGASVYNFLYEFYPNAPALPSGRLDNLMNTRVKPALNIEGNFTSLNRDVYDALKKDLLKPVTDKVERLLNETDVEVFVVNGQLDIIVPTPGTLKWVENLKWRDSIEWRAAPRHPLVVNNIIEGYVKQYGNLKMYWVHRAGHMVPRDNPAAMAAILRSLTANAKWID